MRPIRRYLVTDRRLCGTRGLPEVIAAALRDGVDGVQLREKDLGGRALFELAAALQTVCARHDVPLLINDRIDVALAVDAAGVHLPVTSFTAVEARRLLGPNKLVGVSTHSLEQVLRAERDGADFVVLGPILATPSKESFGPPLGWPALATATGAASIPILAIGGMDRQHAEAARAHGAAGIAAIRAFVPDTEPSPSRP